MKNGSGKSLDLWGVTDIQIFTDFPMRIAKFQHYCEAPVPVMRWPAPLTEGRPPRHFNYLPTPLQAFQKSLLLITVVPSHFNMEMGDLPSHPGRVFNFHSVCLWPQASCLFSWFGCDSRSSPFQRIWHGGYQSGRDKAPGNVIRWWFLM